jgi:hypothetical protein
MFGQGIFEFCNSCGQFIFRYGHNMLIRRTTVKTLDPNERIHGQMVTFLYKQKL